MLCRKRFGVDCKHDLDTRCLICAHLFQLILYDETALSVTTD